LDWQLLLLGAFQQSRQYRQCRQCRQYGFVASPQELKKLQSFGSCCGSRSSKALYHWNKQQQQQQQAKLSMNRSACQSHKNSGSSHLQLREQRLQLQWGPGLQWRGSASCAALRELQALAWRSWQRQRQLFPMLTC
jgi:hypothetical protein